MAKKSQPTPSSNNQDTHDELDLLHSSLHDELNDKELGDIIITTEESITVTLFDDASAEEEEEDLDEVFSGRNNKKDATDGDDVEDFDSYFFEE